MLSPFALRSRMALSGEKQIPRFARNDGEGLSMTSREGFFSSLFENLQGRLSQVLYSFNRS